LDTAREAEGGRLRGGAPGNPEESDARHNEGERDSSALPCRGSDNAPVGSGRHLWTFQFDVPDIDATPEA
jgi:hypothetical protein